MVAIVGAKVGHHHNDALASSSTGAAICARGLACGSQFVAFTAASTAPGSAGGIEECLRAGRCVDSTGDPELKVFQDQLNTSIKVEQRGAWFMGVVGLFTCQEKRPELEPQPQAPS